MAKLDIMALRRPKPREETGTFETENGELSVTCRELNACELIFCEERAAELVQQFGTIGVPVHEGPPVPINESFAQILAMMEQAQVSDSPYGIAELAYLSVADKRAFLGLTKLIGKLNGAEISENPTSAATEASLA